MKVKIWTEAYSPFIMGGDVNAPICTEVEAGEPIDVGRGIQAYVIASPRTGKVHIAESTTGAFVGSSIEQVRQDVESADPEVIKQQLASAAERVKHARPLSPEEFWNHFRS